MQHLFAGLSFIPASISKAACEHLLKSLVLSLPGGSDVSPLDKFKFYGYYDTFVAQIFEALAGLRNFFLHVALYFKLGKISS